MNLLLSLLGTIAVSLNTFLNTANGAQGCDGYTNRYGDVTSAVMKAFGDGAKTVIPCEASSQPPADLCEVGVVEANMASIGTKGVCGYDGFDKIGGTSGSGGVRGRDVVRSDLGDGVNGETPSAAKRLKAGAALVDNDNIVGTARCGSTALP